MEVSGQEALDIFHREHPSVVITDWLMPDLFRIGASSLLTDLERQISHYLTGHYAARHHMPMG